MTRAELRARLLGCCDGIGGFRADNSDSAKKRRSDRAAFVRELRGDKLKLGADIKVKTRGRSKQSIEIFLWGDGAVQRKRFASIMTIITNALSATAFNCNGPIFTVKNNRLHFPLKDVEIDKHPDIVIGKVALLLAFVGEHSDLIYDAIA